MSENVDRRFRVVKICGTDLHRRSAREEIFDGVLARPDSAERHHGNGQSFRDLKHHAERDGFNCRTRKSSGNGVDPRFECFHIDGHAQVRVRHR